jgi:hypothetical protein
MKQMKLLLVGAVLLLTLAMASAVPTLPCPTGDQTGHYVTTYLGNNTCVIKYQPNAGYGKDALLMHHASISSYANTNYGTYIYNQLYVWTQSGSLVRQRSLIAFDLNSLMNNTNGTNISIQSAQLNLFDARAHGLGTKAYSDISTSKLTMLSSSWSEGSVTWNNQPGTTGTAISIAAPATIYSNMTVSVTNHVAAWMSGNMTNNGWQFAMNPESTYRHLGYASSDNTNANLRPKLEIIYTY